MAKFLQRKAALEDDRSPSSETPEPGRLMSKLEALFEFLTLAEWEDGDPRERGTLIVFVEDGLWKACLSDKESDRTCFMSAVTFEDLLKSLDQGIINDSLDWRRKKPQQPQKGRRK